MSLSSVPVEFSNKSELEGELEFSIDSPFNSISISPEKTLFFARHWDNPIAMTNSTGTAYVCRIGDPPHRFDFDVLSFCLNERGVPVVIHVYTGYHNTNEIPQFIEAKMPEDIKTRIQAYLDEL
ncbi:MAG TPA: hypothetical protein ENH86_00635 [Candidatus Jorgensenbacteria bacterium]|nr:hypothetical protein [Candidatus Jorgensenbacteria bacterium]